MNNFKAGDKVTFVCEMVGTVKEDLTRSYSSIIVEFNGNIVRIPSSGSLCLGVVRLVHVPNPEAVYEHP